MSEIPKPRGSQAPIDIGHQAPPSNNDGTIPLMKPKDFSNSPTVCTDEVSLILDECLSPSHRHDPNVVRFILKYLLCRDPRQAAVEIGLHPSDGFSLRRQKDIHNAIVKITDKSVMKHGYDASEVVERVKEIAGVDPIVFENMDGSFVESLRDVPAEARRAVKKFKAKNLYETDPNGMRVVVGKLIEVEMWDKMKAVELLGREKEVFKETRKVEMEIGKNMSSVLLDSQKRANEAAREIRDVNDVIMIETAREKDE